MTNRIFSQVGAPQSGDTFRESVIDLGLGKMAAQIGNAFVGASEEFAAKEAMQDFNENDMAAERAQSDAFFEHSKEGANWRENDVGYGAASDEIRDEHAAKIANPDVKQKFIDHYNKKDAIKRNSLRRINYSKQSKARVVTLNASIAGLSDDYMKVETQEEREIIEASVNGKLDVAAAGGWITPEDATKHKKSFKQKIRFTVAAKRLKSDPAGVLKDLGVVRKAVAPQKLAGIIGNVAANSSVSANYLTVTAKRESAFGTNTIAKTSSARGVYQFVKSTWIEMLDKHGGGKYDGLSYSEKLALRDNEKLNTFFAAKFAEGNKNYVERSLGRPITDGELYIAHFMGAGGATQFLKAFAANPNGNAAAMFQASAKANKTIFYHKNGTPKTMQEVYAERVAPYDGKSSYKSVAPHLQDLDYSQIDQLRNAANTQLNVQYTQLDTHHELMLKNVSKGIAPQIDDLMQIGKLATTLGREDIAQEMRDLSGLIATGANWKTATIDDVRADFSAFKKMAEGEKATEADKIKADFGVKKLANMEKSIKADPLQHAIDAGQNFIEPMVFDENSLSPLNIGDFKKRLAQRSLAAKQVGKFYGNEARYFTNNERQAFGNLFQNADADGKRKLSAMIYNNFGDDLPKALNDIAKNGAANALTISLAAQGNETAAELSNVGAVALRDKTVKLPPENDILTKFNAHVSTAIPIGNGKLRSAVLQVAKQIYAGKMSTGTIAGGDLNDTGFTDSINEALGKNGDKGGVAKFEKEWIGGDEVNQTIILAPNLSKDDMLEIDKKASEKTLEKLAPGAKLVHGNGDVYRPEDLSGDYKINVGSGKYLISVTDPKVGIELVGDANKQKPDGTLEPAVFDYNKINPDEILDEPTEAETNNVDPINKVKAPLSYREFERAEQILEVDDLADFLREKGVVKDAPSYSDSDMKQGWDLYKKAFKNEWNEKLSAYKKEKQGKQISLYDYLRSGEFESAIDMPTAHKSVGNIFEYDVGTLLDKHLSHNIKTGEKEVTDVVGLEKKLLKLSKKHPKNKNQVKILLTRIKFPGEQ